MRPSQFLKSKVFSMLKVGFKNLKNLKCLAGPKVEALSVNQSPNQFLSKTAEFLKSFPL